jgi:cyclic pyranopterin monophosphate synthase
MTNKLTHLDEQGRARMVDVGNKPDTERTAVARGEVHMKKETLELIRAGHIKKGDVLTVAQIAGIAASKRTSELIPLCHPLFLTRVDVDLELDESLPRRGDHRHDQSDRQNRCRNGSPDRGLGRSVDHL